MAASNTGSRGAEEAEVEHRCCVAVGSQDVRGDQVAVPRRGCVGALKSPLQVSFPFLAHLRRLAQLRWTLDTQTDREHGGNGGTNMMWFWIVVVAIAVVALGALIWWSSGRSKPDMINLRASDLRGGFGAYGKDPRKQ
jgi:hypothetical protein